MARVALALTLALFALHSPAIQADSPDPIIHVGLTKNFANASRITVRSDGKLTLKDKLSGRVLGVVTGSPVSLISSRSAVSYSADGIASGSVSSIDILPEENGTLEISRRSTSGSWSKYRGALTALATGSGLTVINNVGVEEYIYGVVVAEIGSSAPVEAVKAQAVAARTYALKNRGRFRAYGFDVDDTTRCQGYSGLDGETTATNAAVDATRGEVVTYQGELIEASYSTDSGGVTACDTSGKCPYLQSVIDSPGPGLPDYAAATASHEWDYILPFRELETQLNKDPRTRVSHFVCLTLDGADASGRITTATISDMDGTMKTVPGSVLRQVLGYGQLKSTLVSLTVRSGGEYFFHGKGSGHGLGMSQVGAIAMASEPYNHNYHEILEHYYAGTQCQPIPPTELVKN